MTPDPLLAFEKGDGASPPVNRLSYIDRGWGLGEYIN